MQRLLIAAAGLARAVGRGARPRTSPPAISTRSTPTTTARSTPPSSTPTWSPHSRRIDKNGDGYVTLVEATGYMSPEQFAAANTNGDDGLSEAEFVAAANADFAKADLDKDGKLN